MGNEKMNQNLKNISSENIWEDEGKVDEIENLENHLDIKFNKLYYDFISNHNRARLIIRYFDFYNNNFKRLSTESITFLDILQIEDDMKSLLKQSTNSLDNPDIFKFYHYFSKWLIPFGETGGGDFICFDYRNDNKTDNPPIVFWCHDADSEDGRVSFVANNFEEFINMLHESEEDQ